MKTFFFAKKKFFSLVRGPKDNQGQQEIIGIKIKGQKEKKVGFMIVGGA